MTTQTLPRATLSRIHHGYVTRPLGLLLLIFGALGVLRVTGAFQSWAMLASIALTPVALVVVPRELWTEVGVRRVSSRHGLVVGVGVVLATYAITALACLAFLGRGRDNWMALLPDLFTAIFPTAPGLALVTMFLSMGLLVPLAEEVFYRGVLQRVVSQRFSLVTSVILVSAGWALVHVGDYGLNPYNPLVLAGMIPSVFLMGLALSYCRQVTSSVLGCTIAQGTGNVLFTLWAVWL